MGVRGGEEGGRGGKITVEGKGRRGGEVRAKWIQKKDLQERSIMPLGRPGRN